MLEAKARGGRGSFGIAPGTLRGLEYAHEVIVTFFPREDSPARITYDRVIDYIEYRRKGGVTVTRTNKRGKEYTYKLKAAHGHTLIRELQVLRRLVDSAASRGVCPAPLRWPRVAKGAPDAKKRGRVHELSVVHAYLKLLPEDALHEALIAMVTGWREGTLHRLRPEYLEPSILDGVAAMARIPASAMKGRKELYTPVPAEAFAILMYRQQAGLLTKDGFYFPKTDYRYHQRKALKKIGYGDTITLRDLRTTWMNTAALQNPVAAAQLAQHADLRTTAGYMREHLAKMAETGAHAARLLAPPKGGTPEGVRDTTKDPSGTGSP